MFTCTPNSCDSLGCDIWHGGVRDSPCCMLMQRLAEVSAAMAHVMLAQPTSKSKRSQCTLTLKFRNVKFSMHCRRAISQVRIDVHSPGDVRSTSGPADSTTSRHTSEGPARASRHVLQTHANRAGLLHPNNRHHRASAHAYECHKELQEVRIPVSVHPAPGQLKYV